MSTARYFREVNAFMAEGTNADHRPRLQAAYDAVRDDWIARGDYENLVKAILGNWTEGNCVNFMRPLSTKLAEEGHEALHNQLWTRTIKRQVECFFRTYAPLRPQRLTADAVLAVDPTGFEEFDYISYADTHKASSFLLHRLLDSLKTWREECEKVGWSSILPDNIEASLRMLRKPRI